MVEERHSFDELECVLLETADAPWTSTHDWFPPPSPLFDRSFEPGESIPPLGLARLDERSLCLRLPIKPSQIETVEQNSR
jgi:hypothetical protein